MEYRRRARRNQISVTGGIGFYISPFYRAILLEVQRILDRNHNRFPKALI